MKKYIALFMLLATVASAQTAKLVLSWQDNSNNEQGFIVERSTDGTTFTERVRTIANIVTFTDDNLPENTRYWYRVKAFNTAGQSAATVAVSAVTAVSIPGAPSNLQIVVVPLVADLTKMMDQKIAQK